MAELIPTIEIVSFKNEKDKMIINLSDYNKDQKKYTLWSDKAAIVQALKDKAEAEKIRAEAEKAKAEAEKAKAEAEKAKEDAAKAKEEKSKPGPKPKGKDY